MKSTKKSYGDSKRNDQHSDKYIRKKFREDTTRKERREMSLSDFKTIGHYTEGQVKRIQKARERGAILSEKYKEYKLKSGNSKKTYIDFLKENKGTAVLKF